ncbi:MAG: recombination regulator RecX [Bacteroides sp.]|nr:recombination regulator RecX [Eubacterium sp.]MCM1418425.1 recombination regulator RecX [Roseburia sp.]MCM1461554.1 recombination regulator RecX [Bacteroides sp.]
MSELETAKKRAMYLLGGKDYSRRELYDKLREHYSEESAEKAVEQMVEYGYLDDGRYAARLARQYIEGRKYGKKRARLMLLQKGFERETVDEALSRYSADEMTEALADLIEQKYADRLSLDGLEGRKEAQKVVAALARRGYGYGEIQSAIALVRERAEERDEEDF